MSSKWTPEQINRLLSLVIFTQYPLGKAPDYDFLAAQLGFTRNAVRQKFQGLKREFATSNQAAPGAKEPIARKRSKEERDGEEKAKEEGDDKRRRVRKGMVKSESVC